MNRLQAVRTKIDHKSLRFRSALETDYDKLITESTLVYEGDRLVIVFEVLPKLPEDLLWAFRPVSSSPGIAGGSRVEGLRLSMPSGSPK